MSSVTPKNIAPNEEPPLGLGGWYYHTGNETIGPLSDAQVISIGQQRPDSGEAVFSRPGFRRWYRYPELSTMLHLGTPQKSSGTMLTNLVESVKKLEHLVLADEKQAPSLAAQGMQQRASQSNMQQRASQSNMQQRASQSNMQQRSSQSNMQQRTEPIKKGPKTPPPEVDNISAMLAQQTIHQSNATDRDLAHPQTLAKTARQDPFDGSPRPGMTEPSPDKSSQTGEDTAQRNPSNWPSISQTQSSPGSRNSAQKSAAHIFATADVMTLRGRLRLGMKRSPMVESLVYGVLSCGLSYSMWYRKIAQELNFHVFNSYKAMSLESLLIAIPVVNFYSFYQMARLMRQAEIENNYRATSTSLTMFLGLIPPLGVAYLQNKANEHWDLHVNAVKQNSGIQN